MISLSHFGSPIFERDQSAIIGYARGCPRLLDNLMNEALMLGAQLEKPSLDTEAIMAAVNNLALS